MCGELLCGELMCGELMCGELMCGELLCGELMCGELMCGEISKTWLQKLFFSPFTTVYFRKTTNILRIFEFTKVSHFID